MSLKSFKKLVGAATLALVATFGISNNAHAQKGGTGSHFDEVAWPTTFTIELGGAANDNWQGNGTFTPDGTSKYSQSAGLANPEFHIGAEIPVAENMMLVPRVAYNDYSVRWDNATGGGAPLAVSYHAIGADVMGKYSLNNFHLMAGANVSTPLSARYAQSYHIEDATHSTSEIPEASKVVASLKGGLGYDIPVAHNIWVTPEAFYTYPLTNFTQDKTAGNELFVTGISGGATLKFALPGGF